MTNWILGIIKEALTGNYLYLILIIIIVILIVLLVAYLKNLEFKRKEKIDEGVDYEGLGVQSYLDNLTGSDFICIEYKRWEKHKQRYVKKLLNQEK